MFYIIERQEQLDKLGPFNDCFVHYIQQNDNYHPKLSPLSLIYVRDITQHKGYILCLDHSESFSLSQDKALGWLKANTNRIFVLNKKEALYHFDHRYFKLWDINFIEHPDLTGVFTACHTFYYKQHTANPIVNKLIPISKHYEECENIFNVVLPIIQKYMSWPMDSIESRIYKFNNHTLTNVFYEIESNGIKVDKQCFIDSYGANLQYPQLNLSKGRIYSQYNLYTQTGRPSNTYNSINFAALDKNNGERLCYRPTNDKFVEFDIQGYHPRILGDMIDFNFGDRNTYETLSELLGVTPQEAKELTFKQLYGGVWKDYRNQPFFRDIVTLTDGIWDEYNYNGSYPTRNRIFIRDADMTQSKLLNYIIQSHETSNNVVMLDNILNYLKDKKTKLVLYTYDAFLFDYSKEDGTELLTHIQSLIHYPLNIKQGKSYHGLEKI
jgi:hypothetical protein